LRRPNSQPQPQHFRLTNAKRVLLVFGVSRFAPAGTHIIFRKMNCSKIFVVVPLSRHNETLPLSLTSAQQVKSGAAKLRQPANLHPLIAMDPLGVPRVRQYRNILFFALADVAVWFRRK
jgi:hypothetical protein